MISLSCATPNSAATRGMRSLPKVVEGPSTCVYSPASATICGAQSAARASGVFGTFECQHAPYAVQLRGLPRDARHLRPPSTATSSGAPPAAAAMACCAARASCGALIEPLCGMLGDDQDCAHSTPPLLERREQLGGRCPRAQPRARGTGAWYRSTCTPAAGRGHPERGGSHDVERFLASLHDLRQAHVARLIQSQVRGDHRGQLHPPGSRAQHSISRVTRA